MEILKFFFGSSKININEKYTKNERSLLLIACLNRHWDIVFYLLTWPGIDLNITDIRGVAGLHILAFHGQLELCRLFLEKGADPTLLSLEMGTPYEIAEIMGYSELCALFLSSSKKPEISLESNDNHPSYTTPINGALDKRFYLDY